MSRLGLFVGMMLCLLMAALTVAAILHGAVDNKLEIERQLELNTHKIEEAGR